MKSLQDQVFFIFQIIDSVSIVSCQLEATLRRVFFNWYVKLMMEHIIYCKLQRLTTGLVHHVKKYFLSLRLLKWNIIYFLMKILLRIYIKVIMFFTFSKKLLLHFILSLIQIFWILKMLRPQLIKSFDIFLKKILRHVLVNYCNFVFDC